MISVICVYNDKKSYQTNLLASLKKQDVVFELIPIDNCRGRFKSAAAALNYGGEKARGKYIIFVHQDVVLDGKDWLQKAEKILNSLSDLGIAGVAGLDFENKRVGNIYDQGKAWGKSSKKPRLAQTLDECLLIVPKKVFINLKFDEKNFNHWHCYGVDYCLSAQDLGLKTEVISLLIHHNSPSTNWENLFKYQKRVFEKHRTKNKSICTTCGFLSPSTIFLKSHFPKSRIIEFYWTTAGISPKGQLYQNLVKRTLRALSKRLKSVFRGQK